MRDIVSCFSENAVNVSNASCSSYSNTTSVSPSLSLSIQNAITFLYKIMLTSQKQLLVRITWCKTNTAQGLSINFGDDPEACMKLNMSSRLFRKKKGNKVFESGDSKIEVFWDLSNAKYEAGPEPIDGFYILVMVDSEIGLILGNMTEEAVTKKFKSSSTTVAKVKLISRQEHCSGNTLYSTRAQFCENGIVHDILIKSSGENEGLIKHPILSVYVDKKTVIRVKRLQWNFRGNQTIFLDGLLIDLLWDVHDWFFNPGSGYAVFMFRTRSGMDSRLWLEEKLVQQQDKDEFSLLIYACKTS